MERSQKNIGGITGSETIMSENKDELMTIYNYIHGKNFKNTEINNRKKIQIAGTLRN